MIWGTILIFLSIYYTISIERVRRNPELFRSGYGVAYTRSPVLAWYFLGRRKEACHALADDPVLRRKYIIECYMWDLLILIGGVSMIFTAK